MISNSQFHFYKKTVKDMFLSKLLGKIDENRLKFIKKEEFTILLFQHILLF